VLLNDEYLTCSQVKEFKSHTARVLHLAKSPDGGTICSGSVDETLKFWSIFDGSKGSSSTRTHASGVRANTFAAGLSGMIR
jgi:WD40 repeat protein